MKVLFLSPDFPLPTKTGLKVRVLSQLKLLSNLDDIEKITFFSISPAIIPESERLSLAQIVPKLEVMVPVFRPLSIRENWNAFYSFAIRRILHCEPYIVAVNSREELTAQVVDALNKTDYDIIYVGYLGMMAYACLVRKLRPNTRIVLEQHNLEWKIFDRLANSSSLVICALLKAEGYALRRYERKALREANSVIAISASDAKEFYSLAQVDSIVIPPFVELRPQRIERASDLTLVYIGHLGWQPNTLGIDWFCREVWPLLLARHEKITLTIAGPGLSNDPDGNYIVPKNWKKPGIDIVGFVPNLEDLYERHLVAIAPVFGGSGVRMKLLETMSAGIPTVTTTDGAAGLPIQNDREVLIADSPIEFSNCVTQLLASTPLRERLRVAGYDYLRTNHSKIACISRLNEAVAMNRTMRVIDQ
jgi:glycosyltransferase involved in cell wall biosynthesis